MQRLRPYLVPFAFLVVVGLMIQARLGSVADTAAAGAAPDLRVAAASGAAEHTVAVHASNVQPRLRARLGELSRTFIGTRYRSGGKSPKGFDCSGFTRYLFNREADVKLNASSRSQIDQGIAVPLDEARTGDLIFFTSTPASERISHVAMITERTDSTLVIVHSTSSRGIVEEDISDSPYWQPRIAAVRDVLTEEAA